jgi:AhpC/TSA family/Thiol:disulfide interchange protein DsbD, N-terminal
LAGISYDSEAVLHNFAERKGVHFPLLSDSDSKIIRDLGILNETVEKTNPVFGIPHPGSFVLDGKGVIVAKYFEDDYRQRYTAAHLLMHQFGVNPAQAKSDIQGKQLKLTATASNAVVTVGQRVALTLEIELKPNMHVYAPGVEGYIPIDWTMKESDAGAAHAVSFPKSQMLHLPAIDETVPAYTGGFRLTRDVTIGVADKVKPLLDGSGRFTLNGTLRYQACDDRVCYVPQNLPVTWTFQFQDLDRQRVPTELQRK